jgi:peptidoglycan/LPS O-acetylase OafA/YrhL
MTTRKKPFNPLAAALTIAAIGATGWAVYTFIIKPRQEKKRAQMKSLIDSLPAEILDAKTEINEIQTT